MFKLVVNIKHHYVPLVQKYKETKIWEQLPFITEWYHNLFSASMYYLNGAHIYFEEFIEFDLTGCLLTVKHPNKNFLQMFANIVLLEIGDSTYIITTELEEKKLEECKMNMCISTLKCFLNDVKFDMLKFATWYLSLDKAHIISMKKDDNVLLATLNYDNSYKRFFSY